ncbi:MAG: dihydrolipoamide acetyltransferase family protein, partial [Actinomycetes bacterium]
PLTAVEPAPAEGAVEPGLIGGPAPGGRTSVLVGYGPRESAAERRPRRAASTLPTAAPAAGPVVVPPAVPVPGVPTGPVLAKPPVRRLAKDLGVDLAGIPATGPGGTVTRADVEQASAGAQPGPTGAIGQARGGAPADGVREESIPIRSVRKATAAAVTASAFTAPHVTEFLTVDATRMMRLVERVRGMREMNGVKVSPLVVVAKALLIAVRRHRMINATWDEAAQEIIVKHYVNLGIAVASARGLLVPTIKDADRLSLPELAVALAELSARARAGRTTPADMLGGTISITNVGVFGVDTGTPILPVGQAAILAFGAVREHPWVHHGRVRPRPVTTLGLSFDHRLVDGELGSRFLADIGALVERPELGLVWG